MYTRHDVIRPKRNEFLGIHYLWRRFSERDRKRRDSFWSWVKDLPNQIPFVDGKAYLYYPNTKGKILKVEFLLVKDGVTFNYIPNDGKREESLEFLTQDEKLIGLGKYFSRKYVQLCKSTIKQDLYNIFREHIENTLRKDHEHKFTDNKPQVITILVGDYEYWVLVKRRHETWVDYEFLGEVNEEIVEIK
jgi:hypothetical protein